MPAGFPKGEERRVLISKAAGLGAGDWQLNSVILPNADIVNSNSVLAALY